MISVYNLTSGLLSHRMVDIYIEDSNSAQLVGSPVKHWLIFTLPPDTFLLILNPHLSRNEAQIGLAYSGEIFQCTFSRHSHLNYVAKLIELFKVLDLPVDRQLTEEWLVLYEIHDFESRRSGYSLKVVTPIYGKEVIVKSWHSQSVQLISNCYRLSQKTFYFLDGEDQRDEQPLSLVINTTGREIYGVFLKVGEVKVCVPFQIVLSEKECELRISPDILPSLYLTCYVEFQSSFCTGIMISKLKLLSAKHLIPPRGQKRGTFVNVRQYPYQKTQRGTVSRVGPEQLDIIEICLSDSEPTSG